MKNNKKWLQIARQKIIKKKSKTSKHFDQSFNYAINLYQNGDYLGALSYFETAQQSIKINNELAEWKEKALQCHELLKAASLAENQIRILETEGDTTDLPIIKKYYRVAFFHYCKLKHLNSKHPGIRQKVWKFRVKSR